ncbi:methyl-accepting chemotaxis protein [Hwanghaeella sp.]|uniref:methyl-accepting chemotaxis protein n=1 Tax=Hwanghaeella sp. TaxID=2605943 RepID=UPI003CCBB033
MKISTKLTLATCSLGLMLVGYAAYESFVGWQLYTESTKAVEINQASIDLYDAVDSYATERGMSAGALSNPSGVTAERAARIADAGAAADRSLESALAVIRGIGSGKLAKDIAHIEDDIDTLAELRVQRDAVLRAGSAGDQADLRAAMFAALSKLIKDSQALRSHEEEELGDHMPPHLIDTFAARGGLWVASEYAGRTRGMLTGVLGAGTPLSVSEIQKVGFNIGHVDTGLSLAHDRVGLFSPEFERLLTKSEQFNDRDISGAVDRIVAASGLGEAYPISSQEWFELASIGVGAILAARNQASEEISADIESIRDAAIVRLALDISLMIAAFVIVGLALFVTYRQVLAPLNEIAGSMALLSGGDLDAEVPAFNRDDEVSDMAVAVQKFKEEAQAADRMRKEQVEAQANQARLQREAMLKMADSFEQQVGGSIQLVSAAATQLTATASQVANAAAGTEARSRQVSEAAGLASSNIDSVAQAAEELDRAIAEVASTVGDAANAARNASDEAADAQARIDALDVASNRIGAVVNLILDIAEQTNLLALNATIEAARAGEAGKGFAVVANEVKSLANQTAKATDEISSEINSMRDAIKESVSAVRGIGETVRRLSEMNNSVAAAVEEQSATTNTMSQSMSDAARSVTDVSGTMEELLGTATETGAAAEQVNGATEELSVQANKMQASVTDFLRTIREG